MKFYNIDKVAPAGSPAGVHYFQSLAVGRHERYFCQQVEYTNFSTNFCAFRQQNFFPKPVDKYTPICYTILTRNKKGIDKNDEHPQDDLL